MNIKLANIFKNIIPKPEEDIETPCPSLPECTVEPDVEAFADIDDAKCSYGIATTKISASPLKKVSMTQPQFERELKKFFKNDTYRISSNQEIFSNLDKVDLSNAQVHLKNMKTWLSGESNFKEKIMHNGYFSSDEGARAFDALAELLDSKAEMWRVSPLSIALADLTPKTVLTLQQRGLLTAQNLENTQRLKQLAEMNDDDFSLFQNKVYESIDDSGCTFEELSAMLNASIEHRMSSDSLGWFNKKYLHEETVIPCLEILKSLDDFPIELKDFDLVEVLSCVNMDNIDSCKEIVFQLKQRTDLSSHNVSSLLNITNMNTVGILAELLQDDEIPISKILEYSKNKEFISGSLSKEQVLAKINNDPFVRAVQAIKSSPVDLIPKNTVQKPLNPRNIDADSLVLVHMTKYEPENGVLLSTRDKLGGSRNSVHFTLNHPVIEHRAGSWNNCSFAVIMPYNSTVKLNGNDKFIEGMPNDLYTNGSVKIPEGSIIMKHNPDLESGTIDISEHNSIKGVKVIETSELPHDLVPFVIEKMGYTHLKADGPLGLFSYGEHNGKDIDDAMDNLSSWKDFCETQGLKATRHTGSAGDIAEKVIENVAKLCVNNSWRGGKNNKLDFKKELHMYLDFAKQLQQKGYFVSYDLDVLKSIIDESATPKEAVAKMPEKLGFHPTLQYDYFAECNFDIPINIYSDWYSIEDSPELVREYLLEKEMKYAF